MIYYKSAMLSYDYRSQFRVVFSGPNHVLVVEVTVVHLIQFIKDGRSFLFFPLVYNDRHNRSSGQIILSFSSARLVSVSLLSLSLFLTIARR